MRDLPDKKQMEGSSPLQGLQSALCSLATSAASLELSQPVKECAKALIEGLHKLCSPECLCQFRRSEHRRPSADQIYKIRNLDTGEELDIRDESKHDFVEKLAKLLAMEQYSQALEVF